MKLKKLILENFRQFHGTHQIEFSTDKTQNVTVLHGENGAGKTSLLNAFKWCFYGRTDFDTKESNILNEHSIVSVKPNDIIVMSIEIEFDHDDSKYIARRTQKYRRTNGLDVEPVGGNVLELDRTTSDGGFEKLTNPESQMNQILPEKMHSYFFFNGERIEKLSYASASKEVREAIRTLMGLEIVERARDHLSDKVKKHFFKQVKAGASSELSSAMDLEDQLEEKISSANKSIEVENTNIKEFDAEIQFVRNKLKTIGATASLQKERDEIVSRIDTIKSEVDDLNDQNRRQITANGFLAFIGDGASRVAAILEDRRQKGELPYQIKQQFVDDLLRNEQCICGSALRCGTKEYDAVSKYKVGAGTAGVEEAFIATTGALKQVEWTRSELFRQLRQIAARRLELTRERDGLAGKLDDISKKVLDSGAEDGAALESKGLEFTKKKEEAIDQRGRLRAEVALHQKELDEAREKRKDLEKKSGLAELAKKRHEIAEECARVLADLHETLSRKTKEQLSTRVNATFKSILQKDYWAKIDDDYCLQIFKHVPDHGDQIVFEKSTGESQVTSLSFIGSIVSLAKEKTKENQFFRGGIFPIVMDSPFGSLDPTYRQLVARHIPELADQIILMVSGTQWRGEVETETLPRVGKHVSLIYSAPKIGEGRESYYVRSGAGYEHTVFEEGYKNG